MSRPGYDVLKDVAPMLVSALNWRNDTGVYASAIARELGIFMEDDEATVLARLREALAVQAPQVSASRVKTEPHDEGTSYCTSLPLHDHDRPGETCPAYRFDDNGDSWPCIRPSVHNYPDGMAERVHIDHFGNEFRVARCQQPQEHGMPHCWCTNPGHHKPLEPEATS
jgi:hypothetical protein